MENTPKSADTVPVVNENSEKIQRENREAEKLKYIFSISYLWQGASGLVGTPMVFFIKEVLKLSDSWGQIFSSAATLGWITKPVWGWLSDRFPIGGQHRRPWFIIMALLAAVAWLAASIGAYMGSVVPLYFFIAFNMASVGAAFVDVVSDALMVEHGQRLNRVAKFVNFQWTVLAVTSALSAFTGGWLMGRIKAGDIGFETVFGLAAILPVIAALIAWRFIKEARLAKIEQSSGECVVPFRARIKSFLPSINTFLVYVILLSLFATLAVYEWRLNQSFVLLAGSIGVGVCATIIVKRKVLRDFIVENHLLLALFFFTLFWKFNPSVGYIQDSYLIDKRGFTPEIFGTLGMIGGIVFLLSVFWYRFVTQVLPCVKWHHWLYAMILLSIVATPLSFFTYMEPDHPWWKTVEGMWLIPELTRWTESMGIFPSWNRYVWFSVLVSNLLFVAAIPAFMIPLQIAGKGISVAKAGMLYALLMTVSNFMGTVDGLIGGMIYGWFWSDTDHGGLFQQLLTSFAESPWNIAQTGDKRALILGIFVWTGTVCTLFAIPFVVCVQRAFQKTGIEISLREKDAAVCVAP